MPVSLSTRLKDNSDITVGCGYTTISVEVDLCTAQWAGFNETQLALNGAHNNPHCLGTVDTSVDPPVLRFQLPVNDSEDNPCRQSLQVRSFELQHAKTTRGKWLLAIGLHGRHSSEESLSCCLTQIVDDETSPDGAFSDFLSIQSVLLTGFIDTPRAQQGLVSYSTNLTYEFSCRYPLQYLLNDTQIVAWVVWVNFCRKRHTTPACKRFWKWQGHPTCLFEHLHLSFPSLTSDWVVDYDVPVESGTS